MDYRDIAKEHIKEILQRDWKEVIWSKIDFEKLAKGDTSMPYLCSYAFMDEGVCKRENTIKHTEDVRNNLQAIAKSKEKESNHGGTMKDLCSAFAKEYQGDAADVFNKHLNKLSDKWENENDEWHSPYFSLVQSSGYGKSMTLKAFAMKNVDWLTIYICLRDPESMGYPLSHMKMRSSLKAAEAHINYSVTEGTTYMGLWIKSWRIVRLLFCDIFTDDSKDDSKELDIMEEIEKRIEEGNLKLSTKNIDENTKKAERKAFWDICEGSTEHLRNVQEKLHSAVITLLSKLISDDSNTLNIDFSQSPKILFAIDEARFLINVNIKKIDHTLFRLFRGALKNCTNIFAVLIDTTSQISNFSPSLLNDPSYRPFMGDTNRDMKKLFHPLNWVTTTDVLCKKDSDLMKPEERYVLGRPLWKSTLDQVKPFDKDDKVDNLIKFAWQKLSCLNPKSKATELAIVAVLTGLSISPISTKATELVSSHMATCLAINDSRDGVYAMYPTEPVLAEVALNQLFSRYKDESLVNLLAYLKECLRIGVINKGQNGELVAKLLLLLARSRIKVNDKDEFDIKLMTSPLAGFLNKLCGRDFALTDDYLNPEISFTCFTPLTRWGYPFKKFWSRRAPEDVLKAFFHRGAAMEFPRNQRGADFLIPVRVKSDENWKYKYILVQVKNRQSNFSVSDAYKKLDPKNVFLEGESSWSKYSIGFGILYILGNEDASKPSKKRSRNDGYMENNVIVLYGKENISKTVEEEFQTLLHDLDVKEWVTCEEEEEYVLRFCPLWRELLCEDDAMKID